MKNLLQKKKWLFLLLFLFPFILQAQNDTINLKEIRISSAANTVRFKKITRQIEILSQKEIQSLPANSLADILEQGAGVDIRQRGVFGMQADINLNGGSFDQALILINGIPVNDPQTGHHNMDQAIDLHNIAKIEIVRGAASRWFGPNAFSGAINIITKQSTKPQLLLTFQAGQHGLLSSSVSAGYHTGKITHQTSVSGARSNGYKMNTDFKNLTISHQSFVKLNQTQVIWQAGYSAKAFGANSFYTALFPDQYETVKVLYTGLRITGGQKITYNGNIRWRRLYDHFELFREGEGWFQKQGEWFVKGDDSAGFHTPAGFFPYKGPNYHRTDLAGAEGSLSFSSFAGKTTSGISWQYENILSNVLGNLLSDTIYGSFDKGAWYNRKKARQRLNFYLNQLYQTRYFSLSAGVNLFYNTEYGPLFSPGLDIAWFVSSDMKLYFSVNRAIRLPTFTDLYYNGPDHQSNPNLQPEKVTGYSLGMQYFMKNITLATSLNYRQGTDIIDWIKKDGKTPWESTNLTRLNIFGARFSMNYISPNQKNSFIQRIGIIYQYLSATKNAENFVSLYAMDYLKHHFSIIFQHRIANKLSAGWSFSIQKRNGYYFDNNEQQRKTYGTVFLLNTKIRYQLSKFYLFLKANNLFNITYRDIGSVIMPGIWITAGFQYRIALHPQKTQSIIE